MLRAVSESVFDEVDEETCTTIRKIAAVQTTAELTSARQLGVISQLPAGVKLTLLGRGFNKQTVKVRSQQSIYFVFLADLQPEIRERWKRVFS
jgi:hypothetical protein